MTMTSHIVRAVKYDRIDPLQCVTAKINIMELIKWPPGYVFTSVVMSWAPGYFFHKLSHELSNFIPLLSVDQNGYNILVHVCIIIKRYNLKRVIIQFNLNLQQQQNHWMKQRKQMNLKQKSMQKCAMISSEEHTKNKGKLLSKITKWTQQSGKPNFQKSQRKRESEWIELWRICRTCTVAVEKGNKFSGEKKKTSTKTKTQR